MQQRRVLNVSGAKMSNKVSCILCQLRIQYAPEDANLVPDLLASHWADDHHLPGWQRTAADARDRLWRRRPDILKGLSQIFATETG